METHADEVAAHHRLFPRTAGDVGRRHAKARARRRPVPIAQEARHRRGQAEADEARRRAAPTPRPGRNPRRRAASPAPTPPHPRRRREVVATGEPEVGRASWYGGRHLGRRTASGERLDSIHNTAAHRSLPLNSLVRVTNLDNGRSVIVRVTDRGPVSPGTCHRSEPQRGRAARHETGRGRPGLGRAGRPSRRRLALKRHTGKPHTI